MIRQLAAIALVFAASCGTAAAAGWSYKSLPYFGETVPSAVVRAADGREGYFFCFPGRSGVIFTATIEAEDKRPNHRGEQQIDYRKLKVTVKWAVDGAPGASRKWEKQGLTVTADEPTSKALLQALRAAKRDLVVSWGRKTVTFGAAGASKALASLAKACGA